EDLHPLQRAFIENHGLQCGYCTPGFLMLATNVLEKNPNIGDEELLDVLASNLCRCTGYQNIIKAVRAPRDEMRGARPSARRNWAISPAPPAPLSPLRHPARSWRRRPRPRRSLRH